MYVVTVFEILCIYKINSTRGVNSLVLPLQDFFSWKFWQITSHLTTNVTASELLVYVIQECSNDDLIFISTITIEFLSLFLQFFPTYLQHFLSNILFSMFSYNVSNVKTLVWKEVLGSTTQFIEMNKNRIIFQIMPCLARCILLWRAD